MINVTNHALERYAERIKDFSGEDIKKAVFTNKPQYTEDLNKMFDNSKYFYTGKFNKNNTTNFHMADNFILVTDTNNSKIITLYRADFGFGRKVDKVILGNLLEELEEADKELEVAKSKTEERKGSLESDKTFIEEQIKTLKDTLKALESNLENVTEQLKEVCSEEVVAKNNYDLIAKKIAYSNIYRNALKEYENDK